MHRCDHESVGVRGELLELRDQPAHLRAGRTVGVQLGGTFLRLAVGSVDELIRVEEQERRAAEILAAVENVRHTHAEQKQVEHLLRAVAELGVE